MFKQLLLIPLAAVFQGGTPPVSAQQEPPDRKVRIEIVTTENGETKRVSKEFDANNEGEVQEALRDLGVLDHFTMQGDDENVTIDIRRYGGRDGDDMRFSMAPMPPMPLMAGEPHAYFGVRTAELSDRLREEKKITAKEGVYVTGVVDETPAAKMGLKEGDVITAINGKAITGTKSLSDEIRSHEPGNKVKVTYVRGGKKNTTAVELTAQRSNSFAYSFDTDNMENEFEFEDLMEATSRTGGSRAFLGVTPGDGEGKGASIGSVEEGTTAASMQIKPGDVITSVNSTDVEDFDALAQAVKAQKPGDQVTIKLKRDGKEMTLKGELGERVTERFLGRTPRSPSAPGAPHIFRFDGDEMAPKDQAEFRREMDELRREITEMRRDMRGDIRRETRITIEAMPLSKEEKDLLKKKGVANIDATLDLGNLRVFPNPSNGFFRLQFELPERGDLFVNVHDVTGEKVYEERITGFKGRYERTLDLTDKATGSYFLVIEQGGRTTAQKLVKE